MAEHEALLRRTYAAFNERDIDAVLATMHPDVDWPNAWEGGRLRGRSEVRDYWRRQFAAIDSRVEPTGFGTDPEARVVVDVHQVVRDLDGKLLSEGHVQHRYTFRDGLVLRMDVRES